MILGVDVYSRILLNTVIKGAPNTPIAQKTKLGWILSGPFTTSKSSKNKNIHCMVSKVHEDDILKKFWEIENVQSTRILSAEESACEEIYESSYVRRSDGRFIVKVPFNNRINELGPSRDMAMARFLQLERKFKKDEKLKEEYTNFIQEYIKLNHMTAVPPSPNSNKVYFLPHHAVIKETSTTTKVRVVFDGSAKSQSGLSLNETMLNGPLLQEDITSILLRWRIHKIAYTADIEKMYRQIEISDTDKNYHRILWRDSSNQRIQEYQLNTVTYGTKSAPYLAIKTLQQLAKIDGNKYPIAAKVMLRDFYVDDLISGNDSIEEALTTQKELVHILKGAGFNLRKWSSNHESLLKNIPKESIEQGQHEIIFDDTIKTLGIYWRPVDDIFEFKIKLPSEQNLPTKRSLLSDTAKLFDPLGWLAPVIIKAKIMFQQLWLLGLNWDDELPSEMSKKWIRFRSELNHIEQVKIPRWINYKKNCETFELHGFCDASESAYAAAVYTRIVSRSGTVSTTLLTAKTKVAPIKNKTTLPRLELCGAHLLANLLRNVKEALKEEKLKIYAWTDSTIVLAWLKGDPTRWDTFVANRIAQIHEILTPSSWNHVKTEDNPADCASRGLDPSQLQHHHLWWKGPSWLSQIEIEFNNNKIEEIKLEQKRVVLHSSPKLKFEVVNDLLKKYSSIFKIRGILAYCKRFINNTSKRTSLRGPLLVRELEEANLILIHAVQNEAFSDEIRQLSKKKELIKKSSISSLNPFLDNKNILRVGGRLENANLTYNQKHPIILPYKGSFTKMIINEAHKTTLHGGSTSTLSHLRKKYWIINALNAVKKEIHTCIICHRFKAKTRNQLMGSLPTPRVSIERPFSNTGVDYAGPIEIRSSKGRGIKSYKGYICIFVCLSTKAVHLEVVSDLTSQGFILALKRFIARRGNVTNLYSDNGSNFVKANKLLKEDCKIYIEQYNTDVIPFLNNRGIQWHFIPACSPHFGGLWEAGVKSIKYHLRRTVGESKLTFEELATLLAQIEACLNSRPLCPISQDINDLSILTPGHFLIGSSILAPPEPNRLNENINLLTRWQLVQRKHQEFWKKWKEEYLSRLQQRPKWIKPEENVKIGELVLLKEDNLPPAQWALGRIIKTHPGKDGLNRVVTVKTAKNTLKRPITKICPLPNRDNVSAENEEKIENDEHFEKDKITSDKKSNNIISNLNRIEQKNLEKTKLTRTEVSHTITETNTTPPPLKRQVPPADLIEKFKLIRDKPVKQKRKILPTTIPIRPPIEELIQENKKRKTEIRKGCLITTLLIALLILPATTADPITITPFTHHPGIYFEDLGRADLSNNEWNIIVFYDMDVYWQEINIFRSIIRNINETCSHTIRNDKILCLRIKEQFQIKLTNIEFKNELIHNMNEMTPINGRQKRGAIDAVGNIFNSLFGVLDSKFAEMHEAQIQELKANENHLLALLKNQTSIAETTKNIIKKDRLEVKQQLKTLQYYLETLKNATDETSSELADHKRKLQLLNLEIYLSLLMDQYIKTQDALLNVLINTHNGKIDPHLLTPEQLRSELLIIRNHLPSSLRIPADSSSAEETFQIYKLLKVKARVTEHNVIFDIRIPLVSSEQYQLFKVIPVPTPHGNEYLFIEPSTDYLITSLDREEYYPIHAGEFRLCTQLSEIRVLCKQHRPLFNLLSRENACEMNLFRHEKMLSEGCQLRRMTPTQVWIQLHNPNMWIYVLDQEYTFNIICGQTVMSKTLKDDGLLKIQSGCIMKHKTMTISSHNEFTNRLNSSFTPSINISEQITNEKHKSRIIKSRIGIYIGNSTSEDMQKLEESINTLKENLALPEKVSFHDVQQYTFIATIFATLLIVGIIILWKRRPVSINLRQAEHKTSEPVVHGSVLSIPQPAPRRFRPEDFELQSIGAENVQNVHENI